MAPILPLHLCIQKVPRNNEQFWSVGAISLKHRTNLVHVVQVQLKRVVPKNVPPTSSLPTQHFHPLQSGICSHNQLGILSLMSPKTCSPPGSWLPQGQTGTSCLHGLPPPWCLSWPPPSSLSTLHLPLGSSYQPPPTTNPQAHSPPPFLPREP